MKKRKRPVRRLMLANDNLRKRIRRAHLIIDAMRADSLMRSRATRLQLKKIRKLIGRKPKP